MTRDDIIRMAREADADEHYVSEADDMPWSVEFSLTNLEAFAALVAAAEREECAKVAENTYDRQIVWYPKGHYIDPNNLGDINKAVAEGCAAAIRARGE